MLPSPEGLREIPHVSMVQPLEKSDGPSRRDVLLSMLQKEFPSYHPLLSIARIAHDINADLKLQFECHRTVAKYVEPELKSLEVKGELGHRHRVSVSLFEDPGAEFHHVEEPRPALEGQASRVLASGTNSKLLPGGGVLDMEPAVTDRVTENW